MTSPLLDRSRSPADAVRIIPSGARIFVHGAAATPMPLLEALAAREQGLVEIDGQTESVKGELQLLAKLVRELHEKNRELYDGLLQRYKEIGVAGGVSSNNISIVDRAQVPGAAQCAPSSFYLEGGMIHLCPETCALVQEDSKAKINVLFACEGSHINKDAAAQRNVARERMRKLLSHNRLTAGLEVIVCSESNPAPPGMSTWNATLIIC